jgi:hypothetical protein
MRLSSSLCRAYAEVVGIESSRYCQAGKLRNKICNMAGSPAYSFDMRVSKVQIKAIVLNLMRILITRKIGLKI